MAGGGISFLCKGTKPHGRRREGREQNTIPHPQLPALARELSTVQKIIVFK